MIRIYHTSDLHGRLGFAKPLAEQRKREPGLYLDNGDSLRGSQTMFYPREPIMAEIDAAGCDAQAIGNREFHYFRPALMHRASSMSHPLVCTNLVDVYRRPLPFVREMRFERDGVPIRLIALLVPQYRKGSRWEILFGWRFLDPFFVLDEAAAATPDDTMLVVLSHLGLEVDRVLAQRVPRCDVILGGHSHDLLEDLLRVDGVPIVHVGPYGQFASKLEFTRGANDRRPRLTGFALVPLLGRAA